MLFILLLSCSRGGDTGEEAPADQTPLTSEVVVSFQPEKLDFGDQDVLSSRTLTLLVHNEGRNDVNIVDTFAAERSGIELSPPANPVIAAGGQTAVDVTWTPGGVGTVDTELFLDLAPPGGTAVSTSVGVMGAGHGPMVVLSPLEYDFGEVKVGCETGLSVSVSNAGDEAIVIDELRLDGATSFETKSGDEDDLPWTMEPFSTRQVSVYFSPDLVADQATVLEFSAGDETWSTALNGVGAVDGEQTVSYTVGELAKATALVHVADCAGYAYGTALDDALPTLFETLNDAGASYRITFLWTTDGIPQGSHDYIDETFSVSDATEAALEMTTGGCTMNNDRSFTTLFAGVNVGDDWMNETEAWEESKLSLIAINNDNDTSGSTADAYVTQAKALRQDSTQVTFHAIGEALTGACQGSVPFTGFIEAVELTEGVFLNICESSWEGHMEKLAAVIMNGSNSIFPLGGTPLESSIEVVIDGVTETSGWKYDDGLNAIVFYDDAYPDPGASLDITYLTSNGC